METEKRCRDCRFFDTPNDVLPCFYCNRTVKNKWAPKDPEFTPEYFSGLNWRDALPLDGKVVEASCDAKNWEKIQLEGFSHTTNNRFRSVNGHVYTYIRTCPETYQDNHPTVTIGGVKLPRPETKPLKTGTNYWAFNTNTRLTEYTWDDAFSIDHEWLANGMIHLTKDRAQAWADWWQQTVIAQLLKP